MPGHFLANRAKGKAVARLFKASNFGCPPDHRVATMKEIHGNGDEKRFATKKNRMHLKALRNEDGSPPSGSIAKDG